MRTVVHLVRHGEVHNPDGLLYGRAPGFALSRAGHAMAARAAAALAAGDVVALVSSPLQRARETAAPLAERLGLDVEIIEYGELTTTLEGVEEFRDVLRRMEEKG